jgi:uncharacterized membrane protein
MNNTNRGANRLFILIIGIVLIVLGAAAVLLGAVAPIRNAWADTAGTVRGAATDTITSTAITGTAMNWIGLGVLALLVVLVLLLVVFMIRQGNGHTGSVLDQHDSDNRARIDTSVVREALTEDLGRYPELVSSSVSSYRVKGTPVLKIAATCRRGVAPTDAARIIEESVRRVDRLVGTEIPALIELSGGFRARVAATTRLQ